jgi:TonB family protein
MTSSSNPNSKVALWYLLLIGLVGSVCFLGYQRRPIKVFGSSLPRITGTPTLLEVDHEGTDLRVSWNHDAPAIALARSGLLSIRDGNTLHRELHFDNEQLRTGQMLLYSPSNHSVQVGLEVVGSTGQHARESVLVLGARDSAPPANESTSLVLVSSNGSRRVVSNAVYAGAGEPPAASKSRAAATTSATERDDPAGEQIPSGGFIRGRAVHQVVPKVSRRERKAIRGMVRVNVKVRVDPSGGVAAATLDSRTPRNYFATRALQAARRWKFKPAKLHSQQVSSEWMLRFQFKRNGTNVLPIPTAP